MIDEAPISLTEFNLSIKNLIKQNFMQGCWIVAEISEIRSNYSGHCYLELIDKVGADSKITAKMRATIWAFTYNVLNPYFESATGQKLEPGMKVMVKAQPQFHELYGISVNITDINPAYTLGEQQRVRQEILDRLEKEGMIDMNKSCPLPQVVQRIAIISSATAAGYGDFVDQLENNRFGYTYYTKLFQATMQGDGTEESVIQALERIYNYEDLFDAVVIIRGGGASSDLSCFDNYNIAVNIAQFPLPVLSGIGHDRDETVVDVVAHTNMKTPTAVAEFIIGHCSQYEEQLDGCYSEIVAFARNTLHYHNQKLDSYSKLLPAVSNSRFEKEINILDRKESLLRFRIPEILHKQNRRLDELNSKIIQSFSGKAHKEQSSLESKTRRLQVAVDNMLFSEMQKIAKHGMAIERLGAKYCNEEENTLQSVTRRLQEAVKFTLQKEENKLTLIDEKLKSSDPQNVLKKGYSISLCNGKLIKNVADVTAGDEIKTILSDGSVDSIVSG